MTMTLRERTAPVGEDDDWEEGVEIVNEASSSSSEPNKATSKSKILPPLMKMTDRIYVGGMILSVGIPKTQALIVKIIPAPPPTGDTVGLIQAAYRRLRGEWVPAMYIERRIGKLPQQDGTPINCLHNLRQLIEMLKLLLQKGKELDEDDFDDMVKVAGQDPVAKLQTLTQRRESTMEDTEWGRRDKEEGQRLGAKEKEIQSEWGIPHGHQYGLRENGGEGGGGPKKGELILVSVVPPVEGLVIQAQMEGDRRMVQVLTPGYKRRGYSEVAANLISIDATRLPKVYRSKRVRLPRGEELANEVAEGRGDCLWITRVLEDQRKYVAEIDGEVIRQGNSETSFSSAYGNNNSNALIPREIGRARMRTAEAGAWKEKRREASWEGEEEEENDSSQSEEDDEVRRKEGKKKFMFRCTFELSDNRGLQFREARAKGDRTRRRMIRLALTDIYGAFATMEHWIEKIIREATDRGGFRPFQTEMTMARRFAVILDRILLSSTFGAWACWNDLGIDELGEGILELAVRISPGKDYPDILDEDVRKWMKRKRFGAQSKWGPVAVTTKNAKATENGLILDNSAWQGNQRPRWETTARGGTRPFRSTGGAQGGRATNNFWGNGTNHGRPPQSSASTAAASSG